MDHDGYGSIPQTPDVALRRVPHVVRRTVPCIAGMPVRVRCSRLGSLPTRCPALRGRWCVR
jgi:hypothetical protein